MGIPSHRVVGNDSIQSIESSGWACGMHGNPGTWETKVRGSQVQGQPRPHSEWMLAQQFQGFKRYSCGTHAPPRMALWTHGPVCHLESHMTISRNVPGRLTLWEPLTHSLTPRLVPPMTPLHSMPHEPLWASAGALKCSGKIKNK